MHHRMAEFQHQNDWHARCHQMIDKQLRSRGLRNERVLQVMMTVPREKFMPLSIRHEAYEDRALPIACGQTISQPYIVAYMTDLLDLTPSCRVLEVGTGSGYQTAILSRLCEHVFSVERIQELHDQAADVLASLNTENATLLVADGSTGLPQHAPYDRIMVTAATPRVPEPLVDQLADNGRMVLPVGGKSEQTIVCVDRREGKVTETRWIACRFVKLIGKQGWSTETT